MFGKINFWECRIFFPGGRGPWRGTGMRGDCLSLLEGVAMMVLAPDVGLSIYHPIYRDTPKTVNTRRRRCKNQVATAVPTAGDSRCVSCRH